MTRNRQHNCVETSQSERPVAMPERSVIEAKSAIAGFDAPEFEGGYETLPYLQMLNQSDPNQAGFFLLENAEEVGFADPTGEWTSHTTRFSSGSTAEGYRSLTAQFLILRRSPLMMFEKESGNFIGVYSQQDYNRDAMILKTRYLVYLVNQQKQLLHQSPLLFTTKTTFCSSFGEATGTFRREMSKAYAQATGAKKARSDRFLALSIFAVQVQPELKGKKAKSWVCSVADYGKPIAQNWQNFFVGYDETLKEKILSEFEEWADFGNPDRETKPPVSDNSVDYSKDGYSADIDYGSDQIPYMQEF
ncbi:DUF5895 domain-containing protein [Phormidesmis sp. 146-12]